jgi:two-component system, HptB-dependent secretion and biofilm response regulator
MRSLYTLVIDDDPLIGKVLSIFLKSKGHTAIHFECAKQATERYLEEDFDLVLVDRQMPGMDGLAATNILRKHQASKGWRPIIMLSGSTSTEEQVCALNAGCDDFIAKPINFQILEAKINSFQRIAELQQVIGEQNRSLQSYANLEIEERRITRFLMERLVKAEQLKTPYIKHLLKPASSVSGDMLLASTSNSGDIYVMLADATGHGLPAALTLIPISQTFYAMTSKGFQLESIVRELNIQHRTYCPPDRFVAALMAVFRPREGTLEVWNGGLPQALLINSQGEIIRRIKSKNLALGIQDNQEFDYCSESFLLKEKNTLLMYSDGLIEAETPDAGPFGINRLEKCIVENHESQLLKSIKYALQQHLSGQAPHDDLSCLQLTCTPTTETLVLDKGSAMGQRLAADQWQLQLQLGPQQLRHLDLEPLLSSFCLNLGLDDTRKGVFSLVLRELLTNALDHGLLGLDSKIKEGPDSFEQYINARQEALKNLAQGQIDIEVSQGCVNNHNTLYIRVIDSGPGYDWEYKNTHQAEAVSEHYHGRGLQLVNSLAKHVKILGRGNDISATLVW